MTWTTMSWLSATLKAARWTILDDGFWNGAKGSKGGVKIWMDGEHPMEVSTFAREHFCTWTP